MNPNTIKIADLVHQKDSEPICFQKFTFEMYKKPFNTGPWSVEEQKGFIAGFQSHGRNWSIISREFVKTRSRMQTASHAQKFFQKEIKKQQKTFKYHSYSPKVLKNHLVK